MLSLEEYQKAIDSFMMEMQGTCNAVTADQLRQLPKLAVEIEEFKRAIQVPATQNETLIGLAFGLFDEFVHATQVESIRECYYLYIDAVGGKSPRHPDNLSRRF
jgi:hypothetical protein